MEKAVNCILTYASENAFSPIESFTETIQRYWTHRHCYCCWDCPTAIRIPAYSPSISPFPHSRELEAWMSSPTLPVVCPWYSVFPTPENCEYQLNLQILRSLSKLVPTYIQVNISMINSPLQNFFKSCIYD